MKNKYIVNYVHPIDNGVREMEVEAESWNEVENYVKSLNPFRIVLLISRKDYYSTFERIKK